MNGVLNGEGSVGEVGRSEGRMAFYRRRRRKRRERGRTVLRWAKVMEERIANGGWAFRRRVKELGEGNVE